MPKLIITYHNNCTVEYNCPREQLESMVNRLNAGETLVMKDMVYFNYEIKPEDVKCMEIVE